MEQEYLLRHMTPNMMKYDDGKFNSNTYPWECIDTCKKKTYDYDMHSMHDMHGMQHMPIQNMGSKMYAYIYQVVLISMNKFMPNKSEMPKSIAKDDFNMIVNDCMCSLTKNEKQLKDMMKSRCIDGEDTERAFCPFCGGMLKSVVEIALITSLINGGCVFCH